jgi:hypothetical protein
MRNSKYFEEFKQAEELEKAMEQMFQYATDSNFTEAACYFIKGAESLKNAYTMLALDDSKNEVNVPEASFIQSLVSKVRGVIK